MFNCNYMCVPAPLRLNCNFIVSYIIRYINMASLLYNLSYRSKHNIYMNVHVCIRNIVVQIYLYTPFFNSLHSICAQSYFHHDNWKLMFCDVMISMDKLCCAKFMVQLSSKKFSALKFLIRKARLQDETLQQPIQLDSSLLAVIKSKWECFFNI
jgi:hypothetical protein